jgi:hypothetical protein
MLCLPCVLQFPQIPHYHLVEATEAAKKVMGPYYRCVLTDLDSAIPAQRTPQGCTVRRTRVSARGPDSASCCVSDSLSLTQSVCPHSVSLTLYRCLLQFIVPGRLCNAQRRVWSALAWLHKAMSCACPDRSASVQTARSACAHVSSLPPTALLMTGCASRCLLLSQGACQE